MQVKHYIVIGNKKFTYVLRPSRGATVLICQDANIHKRFANDEIPAVLASLPKLILDAIEATSKQTEVLRFRVTPEEKQEILERATKKGYENISAYLRAMSLGRDN